MKHKYKIASSPSFSELSDVKVTTRKMLKENNVCVPIRNILLLPKSKRPIGA